MLFIDETGFNLHTVRNYDYSPINTPVNVLVRPRKRYVSLMAMMSDTGIVHTTIRDHSCDSELLIIFLQESYNNDINFINFINFKNKIIIMFVTYQC